MSLLRFGVAAGAAILCLAGCRTLVRGPAIAADEIQLFVETPEHAGRDWRLPQSGVAVTTEPQPLIDGASIAGVRVVSLDLGPALVLDLTPAGAASVAARAGANTRLLLVSHDRALGVARATGRQRGAEISMFVEMPTSELNAWAESIESRLRGGERSRRE